MKSKIVIEWLIENWFLLVVLLSCVAAVVCFVVRFLGMPTEKQKEKVMEWLKWACVEAEKELKSGTGQIKLRKVYDKFCAVPAFKWVAIIISFKQFEEWVSAALAEAKQMLISNSTLAEYVYGKDKAEAEVAKIKVQIGV